VSKVLEVKSPLDLEGRWRSHEQEHSSLLSTEKTRRHAATLRTRHPYPLVLRTQIIAEGRTAVTATVVIVIVTEEEVEVRRVGGGVR
jgi:hypothetical protein